MKKAMLIAAFLPFGLHAQTINTVAGNGISGYTGDGGPATAARLANPSGAAYDNLGNLYISDYGNNVIRKVSTAGIITTVVGNGTAGYGGDGGPATAAVINHPTKLYIDAANNMYIAEFGGHRVRKVNAAGTITTIAGTGTAGFSGDGGPATAAKLNGPSGVAFDAAGNMYIADYINYRIRKVSTTGIITAFAGTGTPGYSGDGGPATAAKLFDAFGLIVDNAQNVYIADARNNRVRKVNTAGVITTFAGTGTGTFSGDGGTATAAGMYNSAGVTMDAAGNFFVADQFNQRIRKITAAGIISTVCGNGTATFAGDGGAATSASINHCNEVAISPTGNVVICDVNNNRVRILSFDCEASITSAPLPVTVMTGGSASFSVTTTASSPTYQWQRRTGTVFTNVPATTPYSGTTTNTLIVSPASASLSGVDYRCIVTKGINCADTTAAAVLTVSDCEASVTTNPVAEATMVGGTATFSITTSASSPTYQWQRRTGTVFTNVPNVSPYTGVNTSTLVINPAPLSLDGVYYRCIVTKSAGCADTTADAELSVNSCSDLVIDHPLPDSVMLGDTTMFFVTTTSTTATYQWQINTGAGFVNVPALVYYSGSTNDTLTISGAPPSIDSVFYRCIVTDTSTGCSDTSNAAMLRAFKSMPWLGMTSFARENVVLYPNPAKNTVYIKTGDIKAPLYFRIYNQMGQLAAEQDAVTGVTEMDVTNLAPGLYFIKLYCGNGQIITGRFEKR